MVSLRSGRGLFHPRAEVPNEIRAWVGTTVTVDAVLGWVHDVYDPPTAPLSNRIADTFSVYNGEISGTIG